MKYLIRKNKYLYIFYPLYKVIYEEFKAFYHRGFSDTVQGRLGFSFVAFPLISSIFH